MEEESVFDPTLKKKKKKKTGFNIDAALAEGGSSEVAAPTASADEAPPAALKNGNKDEALADIDETEMFGKKKSKKKKAFKIDDLDNVNTALENTGVVEDMNEEELGTDAPTAPEIDVDLEFDFTSKKKKTNKKKIVDIEKLIAEDEKENQLDENEKEETGLSSTEETDNAWGDSERDYSYDELLQRAFDQLREKNPEMVAGEKKKFVMKPPLVLRIGSKKSAFANFAEICKLLHRMPKHVLQFLLAELGTSGSIDGNCQLIIKGRFQQKQIENVLRRYIKEYVTCHTCRSSDTILQKDARLYFLQCEVCNSRCSVAPIKSGFQAVANKQQRQAIRAGRD